mgnify:CR=1 FL=1
MGRSVKKGTKVTIYKSKGEEIIKLEDYTGQNAEAVKAKLETKYELVVTIEKKEVDDATKYDDDGNLVNTNPNCPIDYTKSYNGGLLSQNYQLTQGIGNMIPSMTIALANPTSIAGSVVFGLSAGGNAYHTSMVEGNSYMASLGYGIFTGSSEAITQKMLGGIPGLSDAEVTSFKTYLDSVGREAFQESFLEFFLLNLMHIYNHLHYNLVHNLVFLLQFYLKTHNTNHFYLQIQIHQNNVLYSLH